MAGTLLVFLALFSQLAAAQSIWDFGYDRMQVNGQQARGNRPLMVILANFAGGAPFKYDASVYDSLVFNFFQQSVNGYFLENSNGRFFWSRGGVYSLSLPADAYISNNAARLKRIVEEAMRSGINFAQFDANSNGVVELDELGILTIENGRQSSVDFQVGATTQPPVPIKTGNSRVIVNTRVSTVEQRGSLMSIAHELSHQLGTKDLYSEECGGCLNPDITLMGATIYRNPDDRRVYHLDPWHKMQLGWCEPRVRDLHSSGVENLPATQTLRADAPLILYDSQRGLSEYFIIEYRSQSARGGGYDRNVATEGMAIWHVLQDANKAPVIVNNPQEWGVFHAGSPNLTRGSSNLWKGREMTPYLQWLDGSLVKANLYVDPFSPGAENISIHIGDMANGIYRFNITTQRFEGVSGRLAQISVGSDGETWGINAANEIFRFNPMTQLFEQIPGELTQIAVGDSKNIWGLNSAGQIYRFNTITRQFAQAPGLLVKIAVGTMGEVWGLNAAGEIYQFADDGLHFEQVPGRLIDISVGSYGSIWGLNAANEIYRFNRAMKQFQQIPGYLTQIAAGRRFLPWGGYAEDVWGLNATQEIYRFNSQTQRFEQIPGRLAKIAVGVDSVWGINDALEIYRFNSNTQLFQQVPGRLLRVAAGHSGAVWGLNPLIP
jgi:M6 family metalloprotease-like protein